MADHLSCIVNNEEAFSTQDVFANKQLLTITIVPWFADIVNYLASRHLSVDYTKAGRDKLRSDAKYYVWNDPDLLKHCSDQVIRRCVPNNEFPSILTFCHSYTCGGHFM